MKTKLALALLAGLLAGCSSTGYRAPSVSLDKSRPVVVAHTDVFLERYYPRIEDVLRQAGFTVTTNAAAAITCKATFRDGVTMRAHVGLWDGDTLLLAGEASNGGWGTMLAKDTAGGNVINGAIEEFARQLKQAAK